MCDGWNYRAIAAASSTWVGWMDERLFLAVLYRFFVVDLF
jgi:hypothetical protein